MKERPILFSAQMVLALLRETNPKTQTRRVVRLPQNVDGMPDHWCPAPYGGYGEKGGFIPLNSLGGIATKAFHYHHVMCPYGQPGDRLWVRETWAPRVAGDMCKGGYWYAADPETALFKETWIGFKWRPSIFMPRVASRITLEITGVRVERLQEISETDAIAEGLRAVTGDGGGRGPGHKWTGVGYEGATPGFFHVPDPDTGRCHCKLAGPTPAQCAYSDLWDKINGPGSWEGNQFVWVLAFKRVAP